jgi:hypothetical protein
MGIVKKIVTWFKESHRIHHLALGYSCGLLANDWYCVMYGGIGVSGALEFKDWQWGGKPDWIDFTLTFAGFIAGYLTRSLIW